MESFMTRTNESRQRRRMKTRRTNLIASGVLLVFVLILILIVSSLLNGKDKAKAPEENSETSEQIDNSKDTNSDETTEKRDVNKLNEENKTKYGEFYVPLPEEARSKEEKKVRGLYLTQTTAGSSFKEENIKLYEDHIKFLKGEITSDPQGLDQVNKLEQALAICNQTEVNGLVIDIKSDDGFITWKSDIEAVNKLKTSSPASEDDFKALLAYMKDHDIYPIARVVVFKDYQLPEILPEHAMQLKAGGIYKDNQGMAWVNQFDKYVWNYVVAVSKEAALRGFKEIHFDYIRFPDNSEYYNEIVDFPGRDNKAKDDNIKDFIDFAQEELKDYGVEVGAAVFGIITKSWGDYPENIGQTWIKITEGVDLISPMIYPSHYSTGWYGYDYPDAEPYGVLHQSITEAIEKNASAQNPAKIRPWIQAFTAPWVDGHIEYTPEAQAEQIRACMELGVDEYLAWNADNSYDAKTFLISEGFKAGTSLDPENLPDFTKENMEAERSGAGPAVIDRVSRSPYRALADYLFSLSDKNYPANYLLTSKTARPKTYEEFHKEMTDKDYSATNFTVKTVEKLEDGYNFKLDGEFTSLDGIATIVDGDFKVVLEDGVFKVIGPKMTYEKPAEEVVTEEKTE